MQDDTLGDDVLAMVNAHALEQGVILQPTRRQKIIFYGSLFTALGVAIIGFALWYLAGMENMPWSIAIKLMTAIPFCFTAIGVAIVVAIHNAHAMITCENDLLIRLADWLRALQEQLEHESEGDAA